MRTILTILFLASFSVMAQKVVYVDSLKQSITGDTWRILVGKPDASDTRPYTMLIDMHGSGEVHTPGNSVASDSSLMARFGPIHWMLTGWDGKVTGIDSNIIYIAAEPTGQSTAINQFVRLVDTLKVKFNVDTNKIFYSGLSLGGIRGKNVSTTSSGAKPWYITSMTLMSVTNVGYVNNSLLQSYALMGGQIYGLVGNADGNQNAQTVTQNMVDSMNLYKQGSIFYKYVGGHDSWNNIYDPAFTGNIGVNMYQWMFRQSKKATAVVESATINLSSNQTSVVLNGFSTGRYKVATWSKSSGPSATIVSAASDTTNVTGLSPGNTYVFDFDVVNSVSGDTDTKSVTVKVAAIQGIPKMKGGIISGRRIKIQ